MVLRTVKYFIIQNRSTQISPHIDRWLIAFTLKEKIEESDWLCRILESDKSVTSVI